MWESKQFIENMLSWVSTSEFQTAEDEWCHEKISNKGWFKRTGKKHIIEEDIKEYQRDVGILIVLSGK